ISLNYLFEITLQANRQAAIATLSGEMNSFRRDLKAEAFVERKLNAFFAGHSEFHSGASAIAEILSRKTGLKLAAVVTHAAEFNDIDTIVAAHVQGQLPVLPRNLLRRYLAAINQNPFGADRRARKDVDTFLRRQFGLISEIPLEPGRVCRVVSAKLEGPAFFFYQPLWQKAGNQRKIAGGCLVVLRGCDLDQRQILSEAVNLQARGVIRGFSRGKVPLDGGRPQTRTIITDYLADADGQHMVSTFPDTVIVDLIQSGGLVPKNLEKLLARLPLLKVSVPMSELQHPLAGRAPLIFDLARLLACIGAVFLLRLYFFGIDFRMGIRPKVLLGTAVMLLLPVSLLLAGLITWNQFNRVYGWYQAEELQRL
ncbi:MAG TPA: hypothetical protein PKC25_15885, partial [Candidatus Rifleibacterium sp.]|nr:hypothetical protein [Candidatus Rifleibacterium sp.]